MKPSEEEFTAWIDGRLSAGEAARFEEAMGEARPEAEREREEAHKLGRLLQAARKPDLDALGHADFFQHQLLERLEAETRATARPGGFRQLFRPRRLLRLLGAGAVCTGIAAMVSVAILEPPTPSGGYFAEILNPKPGSSRISARPTYSKKAKVTVLWLDGLERVPREGSQ